MKRYRVVYVNSRHPRMDEIEDASGKWVKAEDVTALETRLQEAEEKIKQLESTLAAHAGITQSALR